MFKCWRVEYWIGEFDVYIVSWLRILAIIKAYRKFRKRVNKIGFVDFVGSITITQVSD